MKELTDEKKRIESTMEQYNNPSTFATYSKMQRQLNKLNDKIEDLKVKEKVENEEEDKEIVNTDPEKPLIGRMVAYRWCSYFILFMLGTFV